MLSEIFRTKRRAACTRAGLTSRIAPGVWKRAWTVHVQQIGSGEHAVRYLARSVDRVALTNHTLERYADGHVTLKRAQGFVDSGRGAKAGGHVRIEQDQVRPFRESRRILAAHAV
jgi:hypothetical protein